MLRKSMKLLGCLAIAGCLSQGNAMTMEIARNATELKSKMREAAASVLPKGWETETNAQQMKKRLNYLSMVRNIKELEAYGTIHKKEKYMDLMVAACRDILMETEEGDGKADKEKKGKGSGKEKRDEKAKPIKEKTLKTAQEALETAENKLLELGSEIAALETAVEEKTDELNDENTGLTVRYKGNVKLMNEAEDAKKALAADATKEEKQAADEAIKQAAKEALKIQRELTEATAEITALRQKLKEAQTKSAEQIELVSKLTTEVKDLKKKENEAKSTEDKKEKEAKAKMAKFLKLLMTEEGEK